MNSVKKILVADYPDWIHQRIDKALTVLGLGSRTYISDLIDKQKILVNGLIIKSSYKLSPEDVIEITEITEASSSALVEYPYPLDIVFEDPHVIIVNKPAGLVVHPSAGHLSDTLVNALLAHTKDLSLKNEARPGIVHRIDKDTSGLLVVAKNDVSHENLAQQFSARQIHRIYYALLWGVPLHRKGTKESFIARHPVNRKKMASREGGKWAKTHYEVMKVYRDQVSLVRFKLETGRTHQIRVHASEMGFPIVGDTLYGADRKKSKNKNTELKNIIQKLPRFFLHAAELGFLHPETGEYLQYSRPWPEDCWELLKFLDFL